MFHFVLIGESHRVPTLKAAELLHLGITGNTGYIKKIEGRHTAVKRKAPGNNRNSALLCSLVSFPMLDLQQPEAARGSAVFC